MCRWSACTSTLGLTTDSLNRRAGHNQERITMSIFADLKMYWRFARGLRSFLRHTLSLEEAKAIVRQRMADREKNFLRLVDHGIFGYRRSPYLPLLKLAGCEMGDIRNMVRSKGLEGTLRALRAAGVYITFEEFKGQEPIVRQGRVIPVHVHDFDNPYLSHYYQAETGGTTGAGTRVQIDLDHLAERASYDLLTYDAYGVLDAPAAMWHGTLPDSTGISRILRRARTGRVVEKWFSLTTGRDLRRSLKNRLATEYVILAGRLLGVPIPRPEPVSLDQAAMVALWAAKMLEAHGACLIHTLVSRAVRVCVAAQEKGLKLTGATFQFGGEPLTQAKMAAITRTGARCYPAYHFEEAGPVGIGCARPVDENDQHFLKDALALIQHPRQVPGADITVDAFHFTTLLPSAPKLMLNVESDDYGVVETRSCGCPFETYGFTEHLRDIRSFSKLTSEGVTLVGSEMVRILEEVLPAKFGGSPLDYQLMEEEDEQGFTRLNLLVSPKIEIADEAAVIETVLEALGRSSVAADLARAHWGQAKTLRVKRIEPIWTARGKLMPLHLARRPAGRASASTESKTASGRKPSN
ncbi:MAG: hypothetical protein A3F90_08695 [Deltaproteobacteria bacterium RIFCSPLOWO2_12_FULL_60_19]|nr:MAG: hypothetical protein A3F90_08695 [Deltaproteobacteria bacterium RIFCSPLOWO2_12_FULL_60_19]